MMQGTFMPRKRPPRGPSMSSSSDSSAATSWGGLLPSLWPGLKADIASAASVIMSCGLLVPRNDITASLVFWFL